MSLGSPRAPRPKLRGRQQCFDISLSRQYSRSGLVGRPSQLKGTFVSCAPRRVPSYTPMAMWPSE
eukprot:7340783-Pyramimonas_sp.AAC.1